MTCSAPSGSCRIPCPNTVSKAAAISRRLSPIRPRTQLTLGAHWRRCACRGQWRRGRTGEVPWARAAAAIGEGPIAGAWCDRGRSARSGRAARRPHLCTRQPAVFPWHGKSPYSLLPSAMAGGLAASRLNPASRCAIRPLKPRGRAIGERAPRSAMIWVGVPKRVAIGRLPDGSSGTYGSQTRGRSGKVRTLNPHKAFPTGFSDSR